MSTASERRKGILLMAICAALWSISGIFIKMVPWNPIPIAGMRSLFAAVVVLIYMKTAKIPFRLNRFSVCSAILLCGVFFLFIGANKLTTAANAIVLQFSAPVFLLIISALFLHQKFRRADIVAVAVTFLGISMFFLDQLSPGGLAGNFLAIGAGVCLAGMYLVTGNADEPSRMSGIFLGQLLTAVIGVPAAFLFPSPVTTTAVVSLVILGVVQLGIPYVLYGISVKTCPPLACSLIGAIEPLLNPVWVFLFDGERPGVYALIGGIIVIVNITVWCVSGEKKQTIQDEAELPE